MADNKYLSILNGYVICDDEARERLDALENKEFGDTSYEVEVSSTSSDWKQVNGKWQVRIGKTEHGFKNVTSIKAESVTSDAYEKMLFSYKRYFTGSVGIITDKKIDIRILIKGEK